MKILIVKTSSLGDIIHVFPFLSALRKNNPDAQIDWLVEEPFASLLQSQSEISNVITISTKKWRKKWEWKEIWSSIHRLRKTRYDVVYDLQGNTKSALFTFLAKAPVKYGFGSASVTEWPNLWVTNRKINPPAGRNIREDYLSFLNVKYESAPSALSNQSDVVMVCPGSNWRNKQLPINTLEEFLKLTQPYLNCRYLFMWGTEEEKQTAQYLQSQFPGSSLGDKLPFFELKKLMEQMKLVIAMDSLPLHLAGTTSTPTFCVFGPSSAQKYNPMGPQNKAVQGFCPYGQTFEKRCPILRTCSTGSCIRDLSAEELFEQLKRLEL